VKLLSLSGRFILKLIQERYFVEYQPAGFIGDGLSHMQSDDSII
jgi:hypothetical protein